MQNKCLTKEEVCEFLRIKKTLLYKTLKNDPTFPKGLSIGKKRVWLLDELVKWVKQKSRQNQKEKTNAK